MGISYLVVQFIGFVLLVYLIFFAVICIFTHDSHPQSFTARP